MIPRKLMLREALWAGSSWRVLSAPTWPGVAKASDSLIRTKASASPRAAVELGRPCRVAPS